MRFSAPTDGSQLLVESARAEDPRPLWVLVWGSITDVAQAVHDAPDIADRIRIVSIGSWNTSQDRAARDYLFRQHPGKSPLEINERPMQHRQQIFHITTRQGA